MRNESGLRPLEVAPRLDRLRERFDAAHVDALVVTNLVNVRYLSGFTGSAGILAVPREGALLVTHRPYRPAAGQHVAAAVGGHVHVECVVGTLRELGARGKPAMLALRISICRAYFQCARAVLRAQLWRPETWPGPQRISFGRIIGKSAGVKEDVQQQIDSMVDRSYKTL